MYIDSNGGDETRLLLAIYKEYRKKLYNWNLILWYNENKKEKIKNEWNKKGRNR
jgi:hypothetical protein